MDPNESLSAVDEDAKKATKHPRNLLIIGSGPTALGCLHRLFQLRKGGFIEEFTVKVIEQESEVGGLARTITDAEEFSWDLGVHVTGVSMYPEFLQILNDTVPEWNAIRRCVKADMRHVIDSPTDFLVDSPSASKNNDAWASYVPYPVQNSIPYFPKELKKRCLDDLPCQQKQKTDGNSGGKGVIEECEDFDTFSLRIFGETLQRIFIRPYNEKVWTVKLAEMSCKWVEGRVPSIDPVVLRRRCAIPLEQVIAEDGRQQTHFRYPASGCRGIGDLWRRFAAKFPADVFQLRQQVVQIDSREKKVFVRPTRHGLDCCEEAGEEEKTYAYECLISTIPITELGKLTGLLPEIPLSHSKVYFFRAK